MMKLKKYIAFCTACEGVVATACADDAEEEAFARQEAVRWELRGDVAMVLEYDLARTPHNPFAICNCPRPRAHLYRPPVVVEWVAVTDRMPDSDLTVLICCRDGGEPVWMGWWDDDLGQWLAVSGEPVGEVTHWADLPAAPEDA